MYFQTDIHKKSPPGFEGMPRYLSQFKTQPSQTTNGCKKEPFYSNIQSICAKQCFIFLPNQGYNHHAVEETESLEQLYEMAYRNEFRKPSVSHPLVSHSQNPDYIRYMNYYSSHFSPKNGS